MTQLLIAAATGARRIVLVSIGLSPMAFWVGRATTTADLPPAGFAGRLGPPWLFGPRKIAGNLKNRYWNRYWSR